MNVVRAALRWWDRLGWQSSAALLVSMLSGFGFLENRWLDWLGWFGYVGGVVTVAIARFVPAVPFLLAFLVGFSVNVALWTLIFIGLTRAVVRLRRSTAES